MGIIPNKIKKTRAPERVALPRELENLKYSFKLEKNAPILISMGAFNIF